MDDSKVFISNAEQLAVENIKKMCRHRGYIMDTLKIEYSPKMKLRQVFVTDKKGEKVMFILVNDKKGGLTIKLQDHSDDEEDEEDEEEDDEDEEDDDEHQKQFDGPNKGKSKTKGNDKTGTDFIKSLVRFAREEDVKTLNIVGDSITSQATKAIGAVQDVHIICFTYMEITTPIVDHVTQPYSIRALNALELTNFISTCKNYKSELRRVPESDSLMKYYGFGVGEILKIVDFDEQTGKTESYEIVT